MTKRRISMLLTIAVAVVLTVLLATRAFSQSVAGAQVSGVVVDPTGSAVPGAQVKAVKNDTNLTLTAITNSEGRYTVVNLPVGLYSIEVTSKGFKSYTQTGIILQVGNNIELNVSLQLGAVSEKIEVAARATMVETTNNSISQVVDQERVVDLPLNGRQPTDLVYLTGAAVNVNNASSSFMANMGDLLGSKMFYSSASISVAGGQGNGTNYLLDGAYHTDNFTNVSLPFPFPDALQEFSVETNGLPARYGAHPGAVVNGVTKSGSNAWHGDAFEFLRNGDLDARNAFASTHDTLKRNQFGGTLGGKIIRDKLFFFGGYQGTRNRTASPQTTAFVPTADVLNGDFSAFESSQCVASGAQTLIDPQTGAAFAGNQISTSRFSTPALNLTKYLPTSTDPCGKVVYSIPSVVDEDQVVGRVDWIQNGKHSMFGRYFMVNYGNPPIWDPKNVLVTAQRGTTQRVNTFTLGDNYTISPNTLNAFHASFLRRRDDRGPAAQGISPATLGINDITTAVPNFLYLVAGSDFMTYCSTCSAGHFNVNTWQFADDLDLIRGRHQIAFGVDLMRTQNNNLIGYNENGEYDFNGEFTGATMADFMLGLPDRFVQSKPVQEAFRETMPGLYAQDTFRMNKKVTFNVGLRWEPFLPITDLYGRGSLFNPAAFASGAKSKVFANAPAGSFYYGDQGVPKSFVNGSWLDFSPRLGVAINPHGDGRDSIRIGFGILYDANEMFFNELTTNNPPFVDNITLAAPAGGFANPYLGYPGGNPFPEPSVPGADARFPTSAQYVVWPSHMQPTSMAQWNISYQRQLPHNWMATVNYMGSKTTHIWGAESLNPSVYIPGTCNGQPCSTFSNTAQRRTLYLQNPSQGQYYSDVFQTIDSGNSKYNALLVSLQRRFSKGFTLLTNYTWSHCTSDYDFYGEVYFQVYEIPGNRRADRGNCMMDVRQNFNTSLVARSPMRGTSVGQRILGNWQIAPIIRAISGMPLNVMTGADNSLSYVGIDRPNQVLANPYPANKSANEWINPAAFTPNAFGTFGNTGRNTLRSPAWFNFDVALSRIFSLHEGLNLEVRAEAFNMLNHPNLDAPNMTLNQSTFGQITSAEDPRILEFAVKIHF